MSLSTLRIRFRVVICQLARLRLRPTAQAMNAADMGGMETTEVSLKNFATTKADIYYVYLDKLLTPKVCYEDKRCVVIFN